MNKRTLLIAGIAVMVLIALVAVALGSIWDKDEDTPKVSYKVLLDGKTWFYIEDKAKLEGLLQDYQNQFKNRLDNSIHIKSIAFKPKVEIVEVRNYKGDICSLQKAKSLIHAKARAASQIEVKDGDNVWSIAHKNHITMKELEQLNPQLDEDMRIYPGDKLTIAAEKPVLAVVILAESLVTEDMPFTTQHISDPNLYQSQRKLVSAGVTGKQEVLYGIVFENGTEVERQVLNTKVISPPVPAQVKIGTKKAVSRSGGSFGIVAGRLTSSFGIRVHPVSGSKIFHKGIDIGSARGNPVYAYAAGTVVYAGWNAGYGNFVAIDHGNGMVTSYGHLSAIYVSVGQHVSARQRIGAVGSTGVSTGPHLHFEVMVNGEWRNPLNYL